MKGEKACLFCILLIIAYMATTNMVITNSSTDSLQSLPTKVYVDPASILNLMPPQTFTVSVKLDNVTNLYGIDLEFRWNPTVIEHVSHVMMIPVEDYPGGVLHKNVLIIRDTVDAASGSYRLAAASMAPAPSFNGSGTIFTMTFKVIGIGRTLLKIYSCDLAERHTPPQPPPPPIPHDRIHGYFSNFVVPKAKIYVAPPRIVNNSLTPCSNFTVQINLENVIDLDKFEFRLSYDSNILEVINVDINTIFPSAQSEIEITNGELRVAAWLLPTAEPFTGNLTLTTIMFHVLDVGASILDLHNVTILDSWYPYSNEEVPYTEPGDGFFSNVLIARLFVDPPEIFDPNLVPSTTFTINVTIENVIDMYGYKFELGYNSDVLTCLAVAVVPPTNETRFRTRIYIDDFEGIVSVQVSYYEPAQPVTVYTPTTLVTLTFHVESLGISVLDLRNTTIVDVYGNVLPHEVGDGLFMSVIRDISIVSVVASPNRVYPDRIVTITVVAKNVGNLTESFNVTVYCNDTVLGTQWVYDLLPGENITLTFNWSTAGLVPCTNYTIKAEASAVPYEFNLADNVYADCFVKIKMWGDIDGDGDVDIHDITLATVSYESSVGDPYWNPDVDLAPPWGFINIFDIVMIAANYEYNCTTSP